MNNTTTTTEGQSLLDVALQERGSITALFDLADANSIAITDVLRAGQLLTVPASAAARPDLVSYFSSRSQRINTGDEAAPPPVVSTGQYFSRQFFNPDYFA